jgi:drug/metabolite transporter (DMT)-like permease
MPFVYAGEIAALATAFFWAAGPSFFGLAGRELGSVVVNRLRLLAALLVILGLHWAMEGSLLPLDAGPEPWIWLSLSGAAGLVAGDAMLFQSLVMLGTRLAMLIFSLSPVMAALIAWIFLGETLRPGQILGIGVTLSGIAWVVLRQPNNNGLSQKAYGLGILLSAGGALGQAVGFTLAKKGLSGDLSALSGHIIRLGAATLLIWVIALLRGRALDTLRRAQDRPKGLGFTLAGTLFGPVLGVWISLYAVQHCEVGVAATLMALTPVILLPVGRYYFKEKLGWQAVAGTIVAVIGVALLFLL